MLVARHNVSRAAILITRTRPARSWREHGQYRSTRQFSVVTPLTEGLLDLAIALPFPPTWPPYASTIILATVASRLFLNLPFSIWAKRREWRAEDLVVPEVKALQPKIMQETVNQMRSERAVGTKEELNVQLQKRTAAALKVQQKALLAKHNATPWVTIAIPPLSQLPLFVLSTVVISNMCQSPTPLDSESFLSLTSLSHSDPTAALPIALGIITLANVESSSWFASTERLARDRKVEQWSAERRARGENVVETGKIVKSTLRLLSIGRILWAATVPGGVALYWVTSSAFGLVQTWFFDWWSRRRQLHKALSVRPSAQPQPLALHNVAQPTSPTGSSPAQPRSHPSKSKSKQPRK